jgi:hypothetical protein
VTTTINSQHIDAEIQAKANPKIGPIDPYSTITAQTAAAPELKSVTIPLLNVAW